jgi:hypothetical protein
VKLPDPHEVVPRDYKVTKVEYHNAPDVVPPAGEALQFPNGELVWRTKSGKIAQRSQVRPGVGRKNAPNYQEHLPSPKETGKVGTERSHAHGQGTGWESKYAISDAPKRVNQELQGGIEELLRGLYDELPAGVEVFQHTESEFHWGSRSLKEIVYRVDVKHEGQLRRLFELDINVGRGPHPSIELGQPWVNLDPRVAPFLDLVDAQERIAARMEKLRKIIAARKAAKALK